MKTLGYNSHYINETKDVPLKNKHKPVFQFVYKISNPNETELKKKIHETFFLIIRRYYK